MTEPLWSPDGENLVIHGDNVAALSRLPDASFQLIYIDPPFNTGRVQARQTNPRYPDGGVPFDRLSFRVGWSSRCILVQSVDRGVSEYRIVSNVTAHPKGDAN